MTHTIHIGDVLEGLAKINDGTVQTCVTSPPYFGLRDYGHGDQIGLEPTPDEYVASMVRVFREVRRVLRDDGTAWLNLGDSYGADKQLQGIPWRVAFALQADGWYLRQDIIWHKPNPMPESVTDRCTKAHEYIFLLAKSQRYYYDHEAVKEPSVGDTGTRNRRDVWTVTTKPFKGAHFAVFPPDLIEPCVLAGTSERGACAECGAPWVREVEKGRVLSTGGSDKGRRAQNIDTVDPSNNGRGAAGSYVTGNMTQRESITTGWSPSCTCNADTRPCLVLDPFTGSGTTGMVAAKHGRDFVGCELNPEYAAMAEKRIANAQQVMAV